MVEALGSFSLIVDNFLYIILPYMSTVFVLAQLLRDNSIVDIAWAPGFILVAAYNAWSHHPIDMRTMLVITLTVFWVSDFLVTFCYVIGAKVKTHATLRGAIAGVIQ